MKRKATRIINANSKRTKIIDVTYFFNERFVEIIECIINHYLKQPKLDIRHSKEINEKLQSNQNNTIEELIKIAETRTERTILQQLIKEYLTEANQSKMCKKVESQRAKAIKNATCVLASQFNDVINRQDASRNTVLHYAAQLQKDTVILSKLLKNKNINLGIQNSLGRTILYYAIASQFTANVYTGKSKVDWSAIQMILQAKLRIVQNKIMPEINDVLDDGKTLLHYACKEQNLDIAKLLVQNGANVSAQAYNGETPLYSAILSSYIELMQLLIKYGADISKPVIAHLLPLQLSVKRNNYKVTKFLLEKSADPNLVIFKLRETLPLSIASIQRNTLIMDLLDQYGGKLDSIGYSCDITMFLHQLCIMGKVERMRNLLNANNVGINARDEKGNMPIHRAVFKNCDKVIDCLLDYGAQINAMNFYNRTALHIAVLEKKLDAIRYLSKKNININMQDINGHTALHLAVLKMNIQIVQTLLNHNDLIVDKTDKFGRTALQLLLLNKCGENNAKVSIIKLLILHGASFKADTIKTYSNGTIFEYARFLVQHAIDRELLMLIQGRNGAEDSVVTRDVVELNTLNEMLDTRTLTCSTESSSSRSTPPPQSSSGTSTPITPPFQSSYNNINARSLDLTGTSVIHLKRGKLIANNSYSNAALSNESYDGVGFLEMDGKQLYRLQSTEADERSLSSPYFPDSDGWNFRADGLDQRKDFGL